MTKNKAVQEYNEPKHTLQALKKLGAESNFVSFKNIFNEVKRIRLSNNLKENPKNLKGRVRRSLVLNKKTLELKEKNNPVNEGAQPKELSISLKFPEYIVKSKQPIAIIENGGKKDGDIKNTSEVEENEFKLIKINSGKGSFLKLKKEIVYPDEIIIDKNEKLFLEGKVKTVLVDSYERNPKARNKCIEYYGAKCKICDFDFEKVYGEIGKGFIHVHHKTEISLVGKEYEINPIQDLIPVCPNCHSMLHKKKPAYSIEELKEIMNK